MEFVARLALCSKFIYSGVYKLNHIEGMTNYIDSAVSTVYLPRELFDQQLPTVCYVYAAIAFELLGAALVLFGSRSLRKAGAILLAIFLICATLVIHVDLNDPWGTDEMQQLHAWKNLCILGGLMLLLKDRSPVRSKHKQS
eukprot:NODE_8187_length_561_cov_55.274194_g8164_i0.p1 GENE.NODE_8187_length_561_cov_55.274194_g8164_i0~~NODE_8187_length_561_cov_55.274194_g8164_i0.p1  ORF type:complete len:141 (+),score=29.90 NODE_8187_length_561_cov_55.274194_g8164_i0:61-483(+)